MGERHERPKRDAAATRLRILAAATRCFAEHGYSATGIRDVAEAAGVSLPLLSRYFGSKAGLFEAALRESVVSKAFLDVPRSEFGLSLAKLIVQARPGELPAAIAVLSAGNPEARAIATRVVEEQVVQPLADWLGPPHAQRRAVAITMLGAGLVTHLHLLPMVGDASQVAMDDPLLHWFAASFQRIVDASPGWGN